MRLGVGGLQSWHGMGGDWQEIFVPLPGSATYSWCCTTHLCTMCMHAALCCAQPHLCTIALSADLQLSVAMGNCCVCFSGWSAAMHIDTVKSVVLLWWCFPVVLYCSSCSGDSTAACRTLFEKASRCRGWQQRKGWGWQQRQLLPHVPTCHGWLCWGSARELHRWGLIGFELVIMTVLNENGAVPVSCPHPR
jgi:hypothetical protein